MGVLAHETFIRRNPNCYGSAMPFQISNLCHTFDFQNILLKLETLSFSLSQTLIGYGPAMPFQIRNLCHHVNFQNILQKLEIFLAI